MSDEEKTDEEYMPDFESDSEDDGELLANMNKVVSNVCDKVTLAQKHTFPTVKMRIFIVLT